LSHHYIVEDSRHDASLVPGEIQIRRYFDEPLATSEAVVRVSATALPHRLTFDPAVMRPVIVGAMQQNGRIWDGGPNRAGSNFGPLVDLFAPGDDVAHAAPPLATNPTVTNREPTGDGTSLAAPYASGVAALHLTTKP
ncbi:S8 family serine peptidase, partial [Cronobacter muytjensii]|uniref:S8 family serine peptidase n=1 Tax=Cronobacter muytjensii TaxID=413501 RepID=UPI0034D3C01F